MYTCLESIWVYFPIQNSDGLQPKLTRHKHTHTYKIINLKIRNFKTQQTSALAVLPKDMGSSPAPTWMLTTYVTSVVGYPIASSGLCGQQQAHKCTDILSGKTYVHIFKNEN